MHIIHNDKKKIKEEEEGQGLAAVEGVAEVAVHCRSQ
jgi:hypothetical protein